MDKIIFFKSSSVKSYPFQNFNRECAPDCALRAVSQSNSYLFCCYEKNELFWNFLNGSI